MLKETIKVACSNCNLRELCMPVGLSDDELRRVDELVTNRRSVKRGNALFHNGERFTSLYSVRTGFFKTSLTTEDGRDQVTGFQMAGEIMGLDGIGSEQHTCDAIALEDAEVCVMPFNRIEEIAREHGAMHAAGQLASSRAPGCFSAQSTAAPASPIRPRKGPCADHAAGFSEPCPWCCAATPGPQSIVWEF